MDSKITQEDLIRFVYQETTQEENLHILHSLESDQELRQELSEFLKTIDLLNELKYEPNETILKILNEEASSSSLEMS
ncbi:MAG: hypothetical protein J5I91_06215 [Bacteroidetes bacterium]|nr:hypothetical protein [Bacteroidota bacterium]